MKGLVGEDVHSASLVPASQSNVRVTPVSIVPGSLRGMGVRTAVFDVSE